MKKFLLASCIILIILSGNTSTAQNIDNKYKPTFFSLRNSKLSLGVGIEGAFFPEMIIGLSNPNDMKITYKDKRPDKKGTSYLAYGFALDLYSANSITGLLSGFDYSITEMSIQRGDTATDFLSMTRGEIPLYLKFRLGKRLGKKHFWILLGGVYSFPLAVKRERFDLRTPTYNYYEDENKDQLKSVINISSGLGYEWFIGTKDNFRIALYTRALYPLSNQLNSNYSDFKSTGSSVLKYYRGFDIKEVKITLGLKFLFRFGDALAVMADAATKK